MNEHDSERMAGILEGGDYAHAPSAGDADLVILNTCSIREKAEQKFYSELGRLRELKDVNPNLKIAVAGCIAQQEGASILSRAPYVDMVFGPSDVAKLSEIVNKKLSQRAAVIDTAGDPEYHKKNIPTSRADGVKAWVSIMYGCDNFCTYCVVPYLRGRERSRTPEDIISEIAGLVRRGYKEVTLLGQNVNSYGKGLEKKIDFPGLLRMVNDDTGIERIRFVTSHPRDLSDGLIEAMRDIPRVCEALHLPVQSGSDRVLSAMNRRYTAEEYMSKLRKLRDAVPDIALSTDVIVGFPGEREEDHQLTVALLKKAEYDSIFAFKYSKRPGTAALKLSGHVREEVKKKRLSEVLAIQKAITIRLNSEHVGSVRELLIDGRSKRGGRLTGRTRGNRVVNVDGPYSLLGSIVNVRITEAGVNSLSGELEHGDLCA